jgi:beta-phosphoglucomutase-like phosphatase (HAD superfamily)
MKDILTLWDIDGTLVNVYRHHTPAYQTAIKEVYGVSPSTHQIEKNYGLPAREVVSIPVRKLGIHARVIEAGLESVFEIYSQRLEDNVRLAKKVVLPGVTELLERVASLGIPMGIVTGNVKRSGQAVLKGAGLEHFFNPRINSFADNANYRHEIVSAAMSRARSAGFLATKVYVFGDTPADVEAAHRNNCISVSVIKNSNSQDSSPGGRSYSKRKELLRNARPNYLFEDFTDVDKVIEILRINK